MLKELDKNHPKIDIVYNSAAVSCGMQDLFNTDRATWDAVFEVNVLQ